jgi:hypothetical protein
LVVLVASRVGSLGDVGRLSVAIAVYAGALTISRSIVCEPLILALREPGARREASAVASAFIGATLGPVVLGIAALMVAAGASAGMASRLAELGCALPLLLVQDTLRYLSLTGPSQRKAIALDATWLALFVLLLVPYGTTVGSVWRLYLLSGAISVIPGVVRIGRASVRAALTWFSDHRGLYGPILADNVVVALSGIAASWVMYRALGAEEAGAFRTAQGLFGPVAIIFVGIYPAAARRLSPEGRNPLRDATRFSMFMAAFASTVSVAIYASLSFVGEGVFRSNADEIMTVVPFVAAVAVAGAFASGYSIASKAVGESRTLWTTRMWFLGPSLLVPLAAGVVSGVAGYASATALLSLGFAIVLFRRLRAVLPHVV